MVLLLLPVEIIKMIAAELPYEDVLDLICTNKFLHDLLLRDLYKRNLDTDPRGHALFWCAVNGAIQGMNHLLSWKADVNKRLWLYEKDKGGMIRWEPISALLLAVENDHLFIADLLLKHGADANANLTGHGLTPLDVAVGRGNGVMTQLLLQKGAKIRDEITLSRAIEIGGSLAWVKAGRRGAWEYNSFKVPKVAPNYDFRAVVEVLHLYGANLNEVSLLHYAVEHYGSLDDGVIELLLSLGADVHAKDEAGLSVISFAFEGEFRDAARCNAFAQLLIAYGAKVKPEELTGLLENAIYRENLEDLELIVEYGVDVDFLWCEEGTFLHLVITRLFKDDTTKEEFLKSLLNRGADVLLRDRESKTPLEHAMLFPWNINLAKLLLDAGAKVQCQGKEGAQLLTYLIKDGLTSWFDPSTNALQYYLEDMDVCELIHLHDFSEMDAMIELLLEYGVCPDYADDSGQCPLDQPGATLFSSLQPWLSKRGET